MIDDGVEAIVSGKENVVDDHEVRGRRDGGGIVGVAVGRLLGVVALLELRLFVLLVCLVGVVIGLLRVFGCRWLVRLTVVG